MPDHDFQPASDNSATHHVGSYRRRLPVSLERMYENTLDWEHLPYLHDSSFTSIECLDSGAWGWRAQVTNAKGELSELELRLDRSRRRWITSNLTGASKGAEIWTLVSPLGEHEIEIVVDFFVPDVPPAARTKVGEAYARAYTQLYDEDELMMVTRQQEIDRRVEHSFEAADALVLGPALSFDSGSVVTYRSRDYVVRYLGEDTNREQEEHWVAYPRLCPHQLGPLDAGKVAKGVVTCPWHGYEFDTRTGANLSGQSCQLTALPKLTLSNGILSIE